MSNFYMAPCQDILIILSFCCSVVDFRCELWKKSLRNSKSYGCHKSIFNVQSLRLKVLSVLFFVVLVVKSIDLFIQNILQCKWLSSTMSQQISSKTGARSVAWLQDLWGRSSTMLTKFCLLLTTYLIDIGEQIPLPL